MAVAKNCLVIAVLLLDHGADANGLDPVKHDLFHTCLLMTSTRRHNVLSCVMSYVLSSVFRPDMQCWHMPPHQR